MVGDGTFEGGGEVFDRIEPWLEGAGRRSAPDMAPVLLALRDRLDELTSMPVIRDDGICMRLVEEMVLAPDIAALHDLVEEMEARVKGLLSGASAPAAAMPLRRTVMPRRLLKL